MSIMNLEQVRTAVITSMQLFLDEKASGLRVGELSENDYRLLSRGYGELEWDWGIQEFSNSPNCFSFCFKIQGVDVPDGIAMGVYYTETQTLEMHMMESFVNNDRGHLLSGRMTYFTLVASFLFLKAVEGSMLYFVDPVSAELEAHYRSYGLSEASSVNGRLVQEISVENLESSIASIDD